MTLSQQTLESARQGDAVAIAALINQSLQPKGIYARVTRQGTRLKVLLEADQIPHQEALVAYLEKNLAKLKISFVTMVELLGKQTCAAAPAWRYTFSLNPPQTLPVEDNSASQARSIEAVPPQPTMAQAFPTAAKVKLQRTYQVIFSGVMALILVLIGANLRSAQTLFTKAQTPQKVTLSNGIESIYQAPIISRRRGVPVIMVTFNGSHPFPMIVDTGAGGTLITQDMASTLEVKRVGQAAAQTANGYTTFDVGYVSSIEVDGAKIINVPVAIGLSDMDVGLLGHDFFNNFDVTVREKVVEFRPRKEN
ncbi:retroviral-like aspartic protease family protein [Kovacikia minuta CCNUW1]|uniref:retropepsin-like aspartic protease family protein n=1 Tax=Kovacikia minuta TaxID=2931930 RepID=UPI001CCC7A83|nr:retropepsin-like aspartic protease [Kovacikia minuta]UBF29227.1 retroviral-like aspartic protease family protein [Kovacikia minuta CCNUW1]